MTTTTQTLTDRANSIVLQLDIAVAVAEDAFNARRHEEEAKFAARMGWKDITQYKWSQLNKAIDPIMWDSCEAYDLMRAQIARNQYR